MPSGFHRRSSSRLATREAVVDRGPREPVGGERDRRRGEPARAGARPGGERAVARPARRAGRPTSARCRSTTPAAATSARPARRPADREQRLGSVGARRERDGDEVAAEAALRTAAAPSRRAPRRRRRRTRCRRRAAPPPRPGRPAARPRTPRLGAAAGALLGHHRQLGARERHHQACRRRGRRRRARSGCASRATASPASRRASTTVARPGPGEARAVGADPVESHGDDGDGLAAVGRGEHDELVDAERNPSIAGQTLAHCSASSSSMPWTISA